MTRRDRASYQRAYREAHREERASYDRAYSAGHREEKAASDRAYVYERDGGTCHLCRKKAPRHGFHLDHLVPLSKGGAHTCDNLAVAHASCNARRGAGRLPAQLLLVG